MKKVLKYAFLTVLFLFILMLLVPWIFKDEILSKVKNEANNTFVGEMHIGDISLSLIRDFPNLSLSLEELKYVGAAPFQDEELFSIGQLKAELDIMSVINGESIEIIEVALINPSAHVKILKDGTANYNILKDSSSEEQSVEDTSESSPFHLSLQLFRIQNLNVIYDDAEGDMYAAIKNGNMTLSGDFTEAVVGIKTNTTMDALTVGMDGLNYLNSVSLTADLDAQYNQNDGKLSLGENSIYLNKLGLYFSGWLQSFDDKLSLDMSYSAPKSDFKELLSLVPAVYLEGFEDVKTSGEFGLSGSAQGDYFYEDDNLPAFDLNIEVKNGKFQYPDLPSDVQNINIEAHINHPQGITDLLVVDVPKASMSVAGSPFDMSVFLKNTMTDPYIDFKLKTNLDLEKLTRVVPIEGQNLKGKLMADAFVKGSMSQFENEQYSQVSAGGWASTSRLDIGTDYLKKEVKIDTAYMDISPQKFNMPALKMQIGQSDFSGSGYFDNLLNYALADDTLRGKFSLNANTINVTELMEMMVEEESAEVPTAMAEGEEAAPNADSASAEAPLEIPANLDIEFAAKANNVIYDDLELKNLKGDVWVKNSVASLKNFNMDMLNGKLLMDGSFATPGGKPEIDMDMEMKNVDAKSTFTTFNTVQSFAPVAESAEGNFTTKFKLKSQLNQDFEPDLNSISARGNLLTLGMMLKPDVMQTVAKLLKNESLSKVLIEDADLSFEIENGRVDVKPTDIKVGDYAATFSGSQGLDQTMDYLIETEVPVKNIDVPEAVKTLGLLGETIPVKLQIGGTVDNPTVKPVFGKGTVKDVVNDVVDQAKDSVVNTINNEAQKILDDAQKQADAIMAEARKQADAAKAEAAEQAANLKAEARKQADELVAEAGGNPLKEAAAKIAAKKVIEEADKQIDQLNAEANKQADEIVNSAQQQADKIMADAREKAKINQ